MIISLISLVVTIALAGFIIWRGFANREPRGPRGHGIRRFFQYGTAYLLFVLTAIGLFARRSGRRRPGGHHRCADARR